MEMKSSTMTNIFLAGMFVMMAYLVFSSRDVTINSNTMADNNTIAVDGTAKTFVKPDTASVSFNITKKAPTTDTAMNSVNKRMAELIGQLNKIGVAKKDIKTTNYSVYPEYSYNNGKQNFEGYRVSNSVKVIIRDLKRSSDVLALVNTAGVDNLSQLVFYVDDVDSIKEQLRTEAINDAKDKAKKIAKDLGVKLGSVVRFDEFGDNEESEPYAMADKAFGVARASADAVAATVSPGQNQFNKTVTLIYQIK